MSQFHHRRVRPWTRRLCFPTVREDLEPRLLEYLRAALECPRVDYAEPLVPVSRGFDTEIFAFRLTGATPALSGPLVLRVLPPHHEPLRALRERATQNAVADMGFPAPRAPLASADPGILGGAFLVMERRPGRPPPRNAAEPENPQAPDAAARSFPTTLPYNHWHRATGKLICAAHGPLLDELIELVRQSDA